jgi:hypothetical protein
LDPSHVVAKSSHHVDDSVTTTGRHAIIFRATKYSRPPREEVRILLFHSTEQKQRDFPNPQLANDKAKSKEQAIEKRQEIKIANDGTYYDCGSLAAS